MSEIAQIIQYSKRLKLLYVEDNDFAREATLIVLEEFFGEIIVAVDGEDGFEKFQEKSVDIIITDINMPKMNGLEMVKKIREIDTSIPILVLSAYNESGFFMESIKLGVDGYLLKPIDMQQFIEAIKKVVSKLEILDTVHLLYQYQEVADISTIISKTDLEGNITYVNEAYCHISGYTCEELLHKGHNIVRHPSVDATIYKELWETIKTKKSIWKGVLKNRSKDGHTFYLETTIKPLLDLNGNILEYIAIKTDITHTMDQRKRLLDLSNSADTFYTVLIKIEDYEDIEKFYGQEILQVLEEKFGATIRSSLSDNLEFTSLLRLGEGEYALVQKEENCSVSSEMLQKELLLFQARVNHSVLLVKDMEYDISIIMSLAYGQNSYENARFGLKEIIKNRQDFIVATNLLDIEKREAQQNLAMLTMIKDALADERIVIYLQPIVANATEEIHKYEILVRMIDTERKVIAPFFFLDISKKGKYYHQITERVIQQGFDALYQTEKDISMNLSALDIEKKETREKIFQLLQEHQEVAHRVVFELLEDEEMKDFSVIKEFICRVKKFGVKIAIDDFGAGYSNFERLLDYQPDILKIDACLIKNIVEDAYSLNVVETIINFAKKQGIQTIGEYVENEAIYELLKRLGVDYSQGYYFGQPERLR